MADDKSVEYRWDTRNGHTVAVSAVPDAVGLPFITGISLTNRYTSVITPLGDEHAAQARHVLMNAEIANGAQGHVNALNEQLASYPPSILQYNSGGVQVIMTQRDAYQDMVRRLTGDGEATKNLLLKNADDIGEGKVKTREFAAPPPLHVADGTPVSPSAAPQLGVGATTIKI